VRYLALGDSISIDDYTGVPQGGAASQFARKVGARDADFLNRTWDGNLTDGVLQALNSVEIEPQVVTVTAGGNDFLAGRDSRHVRENIERIGMRLAEFRCPVIMNTIYDPTDGDDRLGERLGIAPERRRDYHEINRAIRETAAVHGLLLADLEPLFRGHGIVSPQPWIVSEIEPNLLGATAIAAHWLGLWYGCGAHRAGV
jgi:lysophospholipase L1-like esterase